MFVGLFIYQLPVLKRERTQTYRVSVCWEKRAAGVYGFDGVGGKSYRVGLSTEYGLIKLCSGNSRVVERCSPDEYLVARGEAVNGTGFRLTGEDVVEEADDRVLDRIDNEGK